MGWKPRTIHELLTTKGDIPVRTATRTVRLAPGPDGQVLTADSTAIEGVAWADAGSGVGSVITGFGEDDLAASLTSSQLYRDIQGTDVQIPVTMPDDGSVIGIAVASTEARTAGTATFEVFINGAATGLTVALDATNTQYAAVTQAADVDTFLAGDRIDVRVTTDGSWAPTTADVEVSVAVAIGALGGNDGPAKNATYATRVAELGPLVHWKLDETSGTTAADDRGGMDGTYIGSPTLGAAGIDPEGTPCPDFDGTDDGISLATLNAVEQAEVITFAAWIEPDDITAKRTIFEAGGTTDGVILHLRGGQLHAVLSEDSAIRAVVSHTVTADTIYHVAAVWDFRANAVALFVDGTLVGSDSRSGLWANPTVNGTDLAGLAYTENTARYDDNTTAAADEAFFDGKISQAAIWRRHLADWEIDYLHAS